MLRYSFCLVAVALCALFSFGPSAASAASREVFAGVDDRWHRYESPHFELFSQNGDRDSRDLLQHLELVRAVFFEMLSLVERQPLEVTVFYFASDSAFKAYKPPELAKISEIAAFYLSRPDRAVIVMSDEHGDEASRQIVSHEFVHHLFRVTESEPPLWFNEGMAELFSTIALKSGRLLMGQPLPGHVYSLQHESLLPLDVLFGVDHKSAVYNTGQHTGLFYAESWGLIHYLFYGQSGLPGEQIDRFLAYAQTGGATDDALVRQKKFNDIFGMDYPKMAERLDHYVQGGRYGLRSLPIPKLEPSASYGMRAVPRDQIRERLTELSLRATRSPQAKFGLLSLLEKNPTNNRVLETLGSVALAAGEIESARNYFERAVENGTPNAGVYQTLGSLEYQRWFARIDPYYRMPAEQVAKMRTLLRRSIERAPRQSTAYEILGWVEASAERPDNANVNLVQKQVPNLRNQDSALLALALIRIHARDLPTAGQILDLVEKNTPKPDTLRIARAFRELLIQSTEANAAAQLTAPRVEPTK